jgi:8-oxo-dGTP diphosphatase
MEKQGRFIIRVYGLILNERNEILLTDEFQLDRKMTKFPGGGLQFGEGTIDCLRREFREECNGQEIENIRHFYTTDFYQESFFCKEHQIISIYYLASLKNPVRFPLSVKPFDFEEMKNGNQSFRWIKLKKLKKDDLSLPIDKFAVKQLQSQFR